VGTIHYKDLLYGHSTNGTQAIFGFERSIVIDESCVLSFIFT
jgi:hypothetical protein